MFVCLTKILYKINCLPIVYNLFMRYYLSIFLKIILVSSDIVKFKNRKDQHKKLHLYIYLALDKNKSKGAKYCILLSTEGYLYEKANGWTILSFSPYFFIRGTNRLNSKRNLDWNLRINNQFTYQ